MRNFSIFTVGLLFILIAHATADLVQVKDQVTELMKEHDTLVSLVLEGIEANTDLTCTHELRDYGTLKTKSGEPSWYGVSQCASVVSGDNRAMTIRFIFTGPKGKEYVSGVETTPFTRN